MKTSFERRSIFSKCEYESNRIFRIYTFFNISKMWNYYFNATNKSDCFFLERHSICDPFVSRIMETISSFETPTTILLTFLQTNDSTKNLLNVFSCLFIVGKNWLRVPNRFERASRKGHKSKFQPRRLLSESGFNNKFKSVLQWNLFQIQLIDQPFLQHITKISIKTPRI